MHWVRQVVRLLEHQIDGRSHKGKESLLPSRMSSGFRSEVADKLRRDSGVAIFGKVIVSHTHERVSRCPLPSTESPAPFWHIQWPARDTSHLLCYGTFPPRQVPCHQPSVVLIDVWRDHRRCLANSRLIYSKLIAPSALALSAANSG